MIEQAIDVNGVQLVTGRFDMLEGEALRDLCVRLRSKLTCGVVLVASGYGDKVSIVAMATKDALAKGVHCGNLVKKAAGMCQGGGGGRPDMAQAGGKDVSAIDGMLAQVQNLLG